MILTRIGTTDIHQRYQTSYTARCNGVVSHGAQFGSLRVFADHTRKSKRKINALTIWCISVDKMSIKKIDRNRKKFKRIEVKGNLN